MGKHSKLIEQVALFEKLAYDPHSLENFVTNHKLAIQAEITGGTRAVNHLFSTNRASAKSPGLQYLDDMFGQLNGHVNSLTAEFASQELSTIQQLVSQAEFYTSKKNAGTGYDPWTRVGDVHSPGAYVDRINAHLKNLQLAVDKANSKATVPQKLPPVPTAAQA